MSDILKQYDVIDTFDENHFQTVTMGIENSTYQDIVIINKLKKSNTINDSFIAHYEKISSNVLAIEADDLEYLIINKYEQSKLLSDYISEETLDFPERIRLAKSFLYQVGFYEDFEKVMQFILINADQLTVSSGSLKFSNYVFMKTYKDSVQQEELHKVIAGILELILELHREISTTELSSLQSFIYQLTHEKLTLSYNDIYNKFKVLASALTNDGINFTSDFETPVQTDNIIEKVREARLMRERHVEENTDDIILVEDSKLKERPPTLAQEETFTLLEELSVEDNNFSSVEDTPDSFISYTQPLDDKVERVLDEQLVEEDVMDLIKTVESFDETTDSYDALDLTHTTVNEDLLEDDVSEIELLDLIKQVQTFESNEDNQEAELETTQINESVFEEDSSDEQDLEDSESHTLLEAIDEFLNEAADEDPIVVDSVEPITVQKDEEPIKQTVTPATYDEKKHSVVLENNPSGDPIQDILNRNEKQHSDLYINQKKKKKKFLPTVLMFFIILILITSLLIFYTSKYM